ncbi:hypothetical protein CMI47_15410 [Candidatus Pacearchaeota archaeon]|nr:hypothetical protein [Candidatus Pacearchaeota archaeon]|tara:strand:+ start:6074 stop:7936 length:1863 start_codon:yes stop_codon:yes gene_type:complete
MENKVLDKTIDSIFDLGKTKVYLIAIVVMGFVLRLIAAINLSVAADDMHFVTHAVNFLSADRLVTYDQSSGLWFAFTSIMYNLFGMTQLTSRIAALVFGTLTILVIYLLTKEFFNERVGLIAAFLLAIAPFHIRNTLAEMDVMIMFFVLLGMFLFVRAIKTGKATGFALSGLFIGVSIYTKVYSLLFIPSLLLYSAWFYRWKKRVIFSKKNVKMILIFLLVIFIFTVPALTHNYLLYKDKGFMDLQFTRTTGLGKDISEQHYGWDVQFDAKNSWKGLILGDTKHIASGTPLLLGAVNFIRIGDPFNFYLGLLGMFLILFYRKEYRKYLVFFLLSIAFVLPFLASIILLPKHFLFLELLLIPASALAVKDIGSWLSRKFNKRLLKSLLIVLLIVILIFIGMPNKSNVEHVYGKSHVAQMIEFREEKTEINSLLVGDSRIYRGRINWALQGRPYLEGTEFLSFLNSEEQMGGNKIPVDVYFFECVPDDCGWGTVKNQPEFNASMEVLTNLFVEQGTLMETIKEPIEERSYYPLISGDNLYSTIRVYHSKILVKDSIFGLALRSKNWFLYDIGYEPKWDQFDYYNTRNGIDLLLDKFAHLIVWLAVIITFLSPFYVVYLLIKK